MKSFNRKEIIGIGGSVLIMLFALATIHFSPSYLISFLPFSRTNTEQGSVSDIIMVDAHGKDQKTALREAVLAGTNASGEVTTLIVSDVIVGTGREVRSGDTVTVDYIGTSRNGAPFANSHISGKRLSFKVGSGEVVKGLERGISGMKEGGTRIIIVPSSLGYGNVIVNSLPANTTLIFSIELHSIE